MKIFVGADHRGMNLKKKILQVLLKQGYDVNDLGPQDPTKSCDYPKIAYKVASSVARFPNSRGILVCMSGIGQMIAANKVRGAYAALCYNTQAAELSRRHNNANILVMSSRFVKSKDIERILKVWLNTPFDGGRHQRRVNQIKKMEKGMKI
ncbi:MAG: ribose 5-phosphate isomerase B [Candidatus Omnitrophica bacterium]|nr:ribose 5-phosphate isomerase B [Candidatus Omnitrophota bacterium]